MKQDGDVESAIRILICKLLVGRVSDDVGIRDFCREALQEWDKYRGNDWIGRGIEGENVLQ